MMRNMTTVEKGDVVEVEYTLRDATTGEVIETTSAEVAKEAGIYDEKKRYGPRIVVVGEGSLLPGLEEALIGMKEGEEKEIEIPPEKAYGLRDPKKIKRYSLGEFRKAGIKNVYPGMVVEIGGNIGIVKSVSGGRVIVDFNNPLAGKTIKAKVKVLKVYKEPKDKVVKVVKRTMPDAEVEVGDSKVVVKVPTSYVYAERIGLVQALVAGDVFKVAENVKDVEFVWTFHRKESEEATKESSEVSEQQGQPAA